ALPIYQVIAITVAKAEVAPGAHYPVTNKREVALARPGCLEEQVIAARHRHFDTGVLRPASIRQYAPVERADLPACVRSEERRVGKECRARWAREQQKTT